MGRKRKFKIGQRVNHRGNHGVIVDYNQDSRGRGRYRFMFTDKMRAVWREGSELSASILGDDMSYVGVYRKNQAIPDRGCNCNCCIHVAIPASEVTWAGTFKGDT